MKETEIHEWCYVFNMLWFNMPLLRIKTRWSWSEFVGELSLPKGRHWATVIIHIFGHFWISEKLWVDRAVGEKPILSQIFPNEAPDLSDDTIRAKEAISVRFIVVNCDVCFEYPNAFIIQRIVDSVFCHRLSHINFDAWIKNLREDKKNRGSYVFLGEVGILRRNGGKEGCNFKEKLVYLIFIRDVDFELFTVLLFFFKVLFYEVSYGPKY